MLKILFIFFCCTTITLSCLCQQKSYDKNYAQAEKLYNAEHPSRKSDSIATTLYLKAYEHALQSGDHSMVIECLNKAGTISQTYQHYDDALQNYRRAYDYNNGVLHDKPLLYYTCLYMGTVFYQKGITDSAKHYFESASALTETQKNYPFPEQERLFNSLGAIYYEIANYQQASNYFEKAKQFALHDNETKITLESNVANCLMQLNRATDAIDIFKELLPYRYIQRAILHNLGHAYFKLNKYDSAIAYFNKVKQENDWISVRAKNDEARIFIARKKYDDASRLLDTSLLIIDRLVKKAHNKDRALNFLSRSILYAEQNQLDIAVEWTDKALKELYVDYKDNQPLPDDETQCLSPVILLQVLKNKASLLERIYATEQKTDALLGCFNTCYKAVRVASYIRRWLDNDEAKMFFQQDQSDIYHDAIRIAYMLREKDNAAVSAEKIIGIMDEYKGNVLYENIRLAFAKRIANVPAESRTREKSLKESLSYYTVQLGNATSDIQIKKIRQKIIDAQVELSRLRKQLQDHHAYDFLKLDPETNSTYTKFFSVIDDQTAVISFLTTSDVIYVAVMGKNMFELKRINVTADFKSDYDRYIQEVYAHDEGERYEGFKSGKALYALLVKPFEQLIRQKRKWVIMPDGLLNYLPFDGLSVEGPKDFLVLNHVISYHYSMSLLMYHMQHEAQHQAEEKIMFFAPFAKSDQLLQTASLPLLPFSLNEAPAQDMHVFTGPQASKKRFLEEKDQANIIHLATHATAGGMAGAMISFYPSDALKENNNLYLDEIYSLDLNNTSLVILSACETGAGHNVTGEGLLSLSRGFMYAGSKGMLSTLWKTEDEVSARLMTNFYAEMKDGYAAEEALQRAKVKFLDDRSISEKYKTPNYWSNFIYVGRINETRHRRLSLYLLIPGALCFLTIAAIIISKKRKLLRHSE